MRLKVTGSRRRQQTVPRPPRGLPLSPMDTESPPCTVPSSRSTTHFSGSCRPWVRWGGASGCWAVKQRGLSRMGRTGCAGQSPGAAGWGWAQQAGSTARPCGPEQAVHSDPWLPEVDWHKPALWETLHPAGVWPSPRTPPCLSHWPLSFSQGLTHKTPHLEPQAHGAPRRAGTHMDTFWVAVAFSRLLAMGMGQGPYAELLTARRSSTRRAGSPEGDKGSGGPERG